ncbi:winged helix-turn-helix transcriptional regulator [Anthocerotibacter panamensis]|uniref:winged helix-turn-helix transcriptional regulator n=1 Tax=Anthocerotibacter panamensis TaxID=2857077 RepID=UPI001C402828|nr:winged helix-turn-helix transcriptional regulator [Anthocerotibacter panamensis]
MAKYGCPVEVTAEVIGGKWKCVILWWLRRDAKSFGELKRLMPGVSQKVLTQQLRELEKHRLILREAYRETPPRVEYALTPHGETLRPLTELMCAWGLANMPDFVSNRFEPDGLRVLLVVAQGEERDYLCQELLKRGVQVTVSASAGEVLDVLDHVQPDALVVDTGVSNHSGDTLIRQVHAARQGARLPAIGILAHAGPAERRQALREGFQVHLTKPVEPAELIAALASLTGHIG